MGPGRAMSGIGRRGGGLALLAALWLAGCAQAPKDLYSWETFARQQHEVLRADGVQSAQQIQDMEAHAQKVRGEGAALPPGFRATAWSWMGTAGCMPSAPRTPPMPPPWCWCMGSPAARKTGTRWRARWAGATGC